MAMGPPVNQPNPVIGQQQPSMQPGQAGATGPGGYTAQGPAGPIQATANTIGAQSPTGAGATRSGNFAAAPMQPGHPIIQGMDSTLGSGRPGGTYSYLFANGGMGYADGGMPGQMPPPSPQMQGPQPQQPPQAGLPPPPQGGQQQGGPFQGGGQSPTVDPHMASMRIDQAIQQHPELAGQLQQAAQQMGITPQNAQQVSQIVMLAMQRPELYPQIRQYCIQTFGLDDADMPPQFDPQFLSVLAVLAHVASGGAGLTAPPPPDTGGPPMAPMQGAPGSGPPGGAPPAGQPPGQPQMQGQPPTQLDQPPMQAPAGQRPMQGGGGVQGPGTGTSDSIPARLSDGEFVIPADVVKAKGTEFFQKLLDQYHTQVRH